ncbi:hypothetical protein VTJ04DRAFT_3620 [Mycothermus thermophilus]|uniref:uncharacterized protein n=1 Tax=Humicola insolens TaxID=85995 RepID=UPI003742E26C
MARASARIVKGSDIPEAFHIIAPVLHGRLDQVPKQVDHKDSGLRAWRIRQRRRRHRRRRRRSNSNSNNSPSSNSSTLLLPSSVWHVQQVNVEEAWPGAEEQRATMKPALLRPHLPYAGARGASAATCSSVSLSLEMMNREADLCLVANLKTMPEVDWDKVAKDGLLSAQSDGHLQPEMPWFPGREVS